VARSRNNSGGAGRNAGLDVSPLAATRAGDRPRAHYGTSETELAVFAATERLLSDLPLHDLSVADIMGEAGISRATFYFYFSSKYAVVTGLLARVMGEMYEVVQPFVRRPPDVEPQAALRTSLEAAIALWSSHGPALRAIHENWNTTDELRALWTSVVEQFTVAVGAELDRQRNAGLAPAGPESNALAAALLWGTERCLYVAGLGVDARLSSETETLEPLMAIWTGAMYGAAGRGGAKRASAKRRRPTAARKSEAKRD
jgi:TetR/AcrR family transcriptional regulator, ethionamide resistance regulator